MSVPLKSLFSRSSQILAPCVRAAHTYSRQDRGLYGKTHKQFGYSISESHVKTARAWNPNVHTHSVFSNTLRRTITMRMTASVWRTINNKKYGGSVDNYLTSTSKQIQRSLGLKGEELRDKILTIRLHRTQKEQMKKEQTKAKKVAKQASLNSIVAEGVQEQAKMEGVASGM